MSTMTLNHTVALNTSRAPRPYAHAEAPVTRLTRRGRLVVSVAALAMVTVGSLATGAVSFAGSPADAPKMNHVVVQPGQSLWGFAKASMPGLDTREAVLRLREINHLPSSVISPGQELLVPAT